ncbi:HD-GYP domain-containing protein [Vibrio sp. B1FLJ16]|uniref:HD-GYP domain-containing protein n=1 Tax=Vibrio sp. B1FLJ16 TaxID=2751178 RepID=UPI0015F37AE9|nr:HD-GYP domain-containing protein [Vibrio sp. B1FLJ16]CAD7818134.1 HD domain [Vibrio sp. B1FLJ16]CAE6933449.1 HD domain [Vibrio sp. B1FLJ16]
MPIVEKVKRLITASTDLLTEQVIHLGSKYGYIAYTTNTTAAWRESIVGVSDGLIALLSVGDIRELDPNLRMELNDWDEDIIGYFRDRAIVHHRRAIELYMYMGLLKYYREAYLDLIKSLDATTEDREWLTTVINGYFNRGEAVTCYEYQKLSLDSNKELEAIKQSHRDLLTHKNQLLSIIESIDLPLFGVDNLGYIRNANGLGHKILSTHSNTADDKNYWDVSLDEKCFNINDVIPNFQEISESDEANNHLYNIVNVNGNPYELYFYKYKGMVRYRDEHDSIIVMLRDISSLVAYENQLETERQKRFEEKQEIIQVLGDILENRSDETGLHVRRVACVASKIAMLFGLNDEEVTTIYTASALHDVGKIAVPDAILNKPGRLTKEEFEIVKRHSTVGYELLRGSDSYLMQISSIIAHEHHEKWDGNGYPCGKSGEDIHIFARIVAIADVFDALLSKRPYKNVWAREEVLQEFVEQKGKHFDPVLCQVLIDNFEEVANLHAHADGFSLPQILQSHTISDVA